jgi:hypothetical protein
MSEAERKYRARSLQGKLKPEQRAELKSDLLLLLNGKKYPKPPAQIMRELVSNCGWDRNKIFGPRPYVEDCLEELEAQGLVDSFKDEEWGISRTWYKKASY